MFRKFLGMAVGGGGKKKILSNFYAFLRIFYVLRFLKNFQISTIFLKFQFDQKHLNFGAEIHLDCNFSIFLKCFSVFCQVSGDIVTLDASNYTKHVSIKMDIFYRNPALIT